MSVSLLDQRELRVERQKGRLLSEQGDNLHSLGNGAAETRYLQQRASLTIANQS